ncbi:MAG TPA: metallophosphoesterase [Candidatus Hydrogenedentes bacterium]|nr:metallophosphoesterase [Candidatus Hydrogenedentota bacterium]HOL76566.1 metallophosphoesterase [Candidatus Hydrogenedentota bacterium]HPO85229.1 metallophosphoesterase [Candidatus Hydrogenedentota bacterium]
MNPSDDTPVVYTNEKGTVRILVIADLHTNVTEEANRKTWRDVRSFISSTKPHLLVVLGDVWCGDDQAHEASDWMNRDLALLGSLGVPWAFVWGNHDYGIDTYWGNKAISDTPNSLMPENTYNGNYRVQIAESKSDGRLLWDLYVLNSHTWSLLPEDVMWFEQESQRLYATRGRLVPAMVFFHIPLEQFETARSSGRFNGEANEEVGYWGNTASLGQPIIRTRNVRACFVGHSHANDFSFTQDGILFSYARATGYGGYGEKHLQKGAKLILGKGADIKCKTLFARNTTTSV